MTALTSDSSGLPWLSVLIFSPLLAAFVAAWIRDERLLRWWALLSTTVVALLSLPLYAQFDPTATGFQFRENLTWIPALGIEYSLGLDGISLLLVLLTTLIMPLAVLAAWRSITVRVREFMICLLVMETAMIGVFSALDAILFFIFWEGMLIPMALLIGVWGGARRVYAAMKFFIYTIAGSIFLLVALIALRLQTGSFSLPGMMGQPYSEGFQLWVFGAFFVSFAIKVPMFPFHTWLPAAHVEAPTTGSVLLASVLLKMGTYGFLRFCLPITPYATQVFAPVLLVLSVVGILYGGLTALAQNDLKKLVAYSSVAHMGFATFGIFLLNPAGLQGAVLIMINHGITTGALFVCVGLMYERLHTRDLDQLAGVGRLMPLFAAAFGVFCLSSLAFPGTNSFIGEFLVLAGGFQHSLWLTLATVPGVVLAAAYMLRTLQKVAWGGTDNPRHHGLTDLNAREIILVLPLVVGVFWIGLHPQPLLHVMTTSVHHVLHAVSLGGVEAAAAALR